MGAPECRQNGIHHKKIIHYVHKYVVYYFQVDISQSNFFNSFCRFYYNHQFVYYTNLTFGLNLNSMRLTS